MSDENWRTATLDIANCRRVEMVVPLKNGEPAGIMFETWPEVVRRQVKTCLLAWLSEHQDRAIRAISYGLAANAKGDRCCVTVLHHAEPRGEKYAVVDNANGTCEAA